MILVPGVQVTNVLDLLDAGGRGSNPKSYLGKDWFYSRYIMIYLKLDVYMIDIYPKLYSLMIYLRLDGYMMDISNERLC